MKKIKLFRALKHDYALLGCAIIVVLSCLVIGYALYVSLVDSVYIFGPLAIGFALLGLWRYTYLKSLFKNGIEVKGEVSNIWFMKDRGRVTYQYQIGDFIYTKGNAIMKTKETKDLGIGSIVTLLVKKSNHKKAIIRDLYS